MRNIGDNVYFYIVFFTFFYKLLFSFIVNISEKCRFTFRYILQSVI